MPGRLDKEMAERDRSCGTPNFEEAPADPVSLDAAPSRGYSARTTVLTGSPQHEGPRRFLSREARFPCHFNRRSSIY